MILLTKKECVNFLQKCFIQSPLGPNPVNMFTSNFTRSFTKLDHFSATKKIFTNHKRWMNLHQKTDSIFPM